MVYNLLKDEMAAAGGIHALQLRTRTPEEEAKLKAREAEDAKAWGEAVPVAEVENTAR